MINPKTIKMIVLGVIVLACVAFFGLWRYEVKDHEITAGLLKTAQAVITKHEANVKISERTSHAYQNDIDRLRADVKRLRAIPARCIPFADTPILPADQRSGRGYAAENGKGAGIRTDWLYQYAEDCEQIRIERNSCKAFVTSVYDAR